MSADHSILVKPFVGTNINVKGRFSRLSLSHTLCDSKPQTHIHSSVCKGCCIPTTEKRPMTRESSNVITTLRIIEKSHFFFVSSPSTVAGNVKLADEIWCVDEHCGQKEKRKEIQEHL